MQHGLKRKGGIIIQIPLFVYILLFAIVFFAVLTLTSKKGSQNNNYLKFVEEIEKEKSQASQQTQLEKYLTPLLKLTNSKIKISASKEEELRRKFKEANMSMDPASFYMYKILYPVICFIFLLFIGMAYDNTIILIMAAGSILTYFYPDYNLKKRLKLAKERRKFELPSYLMPLGVRLQAFTTYDAVKGSKEMAGPYLRPFVEELIIEMETFQGSNKPFKNFAEKLDIPEAHTFVIALQQAINVDPVKGREIIQQQIDVSRKLRDQNYNALISARPLLMNKYNVVTVGCILIVPFTIVGVTLVSAFSSI